MNIKSIKFLFSGQTIKTFVEKNNIPMPHEEISGVYEALGIALLILGVIPGVVLKSDGVI